MNDLEEIRRLLPPAAAPDPSVVAQARARMFTQAPESARPKLGRRLVITAAIGAAVATGIVALPGDSGKPLSGRDVLLVAATQAAKEPLATGKYYRTRVIHQSTEKFGLAPNTYHYDTRGLAEIWVAADPAKPDHYGTVRLGGKPTTPADAEAWKRDGSPTVLKLPMMILGQPAMVDATPGGAKLETVNREDVIGYGSTPDGKPITFTREEWAALPADPAELKAFLLNRPLASQVSQKDWLIRFAMYFLSEFPVRPEARAGLFKMLAGLDGVTSDGPVTDPQGRKGMGVTIAPEPGRNETPHKLIVDTNTGKLLSYGSEGKATPGVDGPQGPYWEIVLSAEWTNDEPKPPSTATP
ncbi:CU044_5270 family protein [Amycolatopsis sp. NPDC059657]|uniref:CU044_5270 family protein n=1 Tax=Amycolatopsis sp. NPDC059657 TaxID=3346899 RepID=UPI0036733FC0